MSNALISLGAIVRDALELGQSVDLADLGSFRIVGASQDDGHRGRSYGRQPEGTENSLYAKSCHA